MNVSLRWLSELLGTTLEARDVRDRLALLGAPVDAMDTVHGDLAQVVVGLVLEAKKHPNADRLSLTRVDAGGPEPFSVVCGAPNVTAGKKYPFAPVGTVLPGGLKLERRKIRGETSEGMLCSAKELALGIDGDGILELNTDAAPGTPFLEAMPISDTRYLVDVTANRPDLLSHEGLARDLGVVLRKHVTLPPLKGAPEPPRVSRAAGASGEAAGVRVSIEDTAGCPRYTAVVIRGVTVGPSPDWLKNRLAAVGSRSISNVVDATNYLMLENGQPLHAFDLAKLEGPAVVIRQSAAGETLRTLDGVERKLEAGHCVIADAKRAVALAGVMGGADTEVTAGTTDILLECAYFDPVRTRRLRRSLGMSTDASYRYERGVDYEATAARVARAAQLIVAVAGGRIEGAVDVYPQPIAHRTIFLRDARLAQVLGAQVARGEVERVLTAAGCVVSPKDDRVAVQVPAWRPDLQKEIDLVEEVARLVGFDRFPDDLRGFRPGTVPDSPVEQLSDRLRAMLTGLGLHEALTLPLGPADGGPNQVEVLNPLSKEEAFLRRTLLSSLARRAEHNWRQMNRDIRLFEIGHVFEWHKGAAGVGHNHVVEAGGRTYELPHEENRLAGIISGARRPPHWSEPNPPDCDLFDLKGLVEAVIGAARPDASLEPKDGGWAIVASGKTIGSAREIDADRPAWAGKLYGFEIKLPKAPERPTPRYQPLPLWPAVQRDVALILAGGKSAAEVEAALKQSAGKLLEKLYVFDEYQGKPLAEGERSVAWRFVFRAGDRTLRDQEVDQDLERAVRAAQETHGVRRREA